MKRTSTHVLLLSGMALSFSALAASPAAPAQQVPASSSASKVAIDPVTGLIRPVTEAESEALDAKAKADAQSRQRSLRATPAPRVPAFPATAAEALSNARSAHGIIGFKPPIDTMSMLMISRDASGKVTIEHGEPGQDAPLPTAVSAQELPSE